MRPHFVSELCEVAEFLTIDFVTKKWFHAVYRTDRDRFVDLITHQLNF